MKLTLAFRPTAVRRPTTTGRVVAFNTVSRDYQVRKYVNDYTHRERWVALVWCGQTGSWENVEHRPGVHPALVDYKTKRAAQLACEKHHRARQSAASK